MAPRLLLVSRFPTIPISDFRNLVSFGVALRDYGLFGNYWFWEYLSPGLPLILCGLFHVFAGADPAAVARLATAVVCGLAPIVPLVLWRGVFPLWVRFLAGAALALWPGQILFSGVVAQDNWILLPAVALASLAVAPLRSRLGMVATALVYAAAAAVRQEMLIVLIPLFLAAAGWRRVAAAACIAAVPLAAIAAYRYGVTGRFALTSVHSGSAILSSYIPGAAANAYADPYPFTASVRPDLLRDRQGFFAEAGHLALREALRRPAFHAVRIVSWLCTFAVSGEASTLYWSLGSPEVLPGNLRARGAALAEIAGKPLRFELAAIQALFLASILIAIPRRNIAILMLALAVLLKYLLHGLTATQGRYFLVATALELLAITLAVYEVRRGAAMVRPLLAGMAFAAALLVIAPRLAAFVESRDTDQQRTYRFVVEPKEPGAELACTVDHGLLVFLERDRPLYSSPRGRVLGATLRTFDRDPAPGQAATASCELTGTGAPRPLVLEVLDPYAPGGFPDRLVQRVELDGVEVFSHDIAKDPGSGWAHIPLGNVGEGTRRKVVIEVKAIRPDAGPGWGDAARTTFRLAWEPGQ